MTVVSDDLQEWAQRLIARSQATNEMAVDYFTRDRHEEMLACSQQESGGANATIGDGVEYWNERVTPPWRVRLYFVEGSRDHE